MKKYKIYRNLHKNCFTVLKYNREKKGYRVHSYVTHGFIYGVEARVSEAGRQRVIKEKQKNVHAYLLCDKFEKRDSPIYGYTYHKEIYYNPYKHDTFIVDYEPFESASRVMLTTVGDGTPKAFLMQK